ncbi:MAG: Gfo/Idh/MocA family oxidoreductase [Candidatus Solibacter usitatus]|nr:Gfo/Idh/MocA family oxidoreductase [Candidatus Solibacter usitatus]
MNPSKLNRRSFFASSLTALSALNVLGANDRVQLGFIGLGGRARWLLQNEEFPNADIAAFADCFLPQCDRAAVIRPSYAKAVKYQDYRRMFDKEKLDAVFVETTTHARVLVAMHALQAGLDVYGEKPLTLTVSEGRILERAVRHHKRVLQTGTQQRSIPINAWASKFIREGGIGKVGEVIACNFEPPKRWTPQPEQPIPEGLDWDVWCNQTELRPYNKELQTRWAWYRDYDNGGQSWGVSGWGTHALDQVQCALGADDTGPVEMWTEGEGPEAPVIMRYASGTLLKMTGAKRPDHSDLGAIFKGEKGTIEIKRGTILADPIELVKDKPADTVEGPGEDRWHIENFLDCIRTRKRPNADVEIGHRSTSVCHLVTICRDLGRKLRWDPNAEQFDNDAEGNAMLSRPRRKGYELPKV